MQVTSSDSNAPDDARILQQVERELRSDGSRRASKTPVVAGIALLACLSVGALAITRLRPVEAARATPRWVPWTYSFEDAQVRAAKTRQKIFIDFYARRAKGWTRMFIPGPKCCASRKTP